MNGACGLPDAAWRCVLCGAEGKRVIGAYRPQSIGADGIWANRAIVSCRVCDFCQISPIPGLNELRHYYQAVYRSDGSYGQSTADIERFPFDHPRLLRRGRGIASLVADMHGGNVKGVLDIGAGYGHALWSARERFGSTSLHAIECSPWCRPFLESNGVEVYPQDLAEALGSIRGKRLIDLVIMSHILEHLGDPLSALSAVRGVLRPEGCLAIEVPNDGGAAVEDLSIHEPHLLFFTKQTLSSMVERAGFQVLFVDSVGPKRYAPLVLLIRRALARMLPHSVRADVVKRRQSDVGPASSETCAQDRYGGNRVWLRCIARSRA